MDFTRQPIVESIITPREGFRLVVRSSKSMGQEEHFVDALEMVSFGSGLFFRSSERPKPFLVPASDYEVIEVREQRLLLKTPANEGEKAKSAPMQRREPNREPRSYTPPAQPSSFEAKEEAEDEGVSFQGAESAEAGRFEGQPRPPGRPQEGRGGEPRPERRRDRSRRRRDRGPRDERREGEFTPQPGQTGEISAEIASQPSSAEMALSPVGGEASQGQEQAAGQMTPPPLFRTILPPPTTLIRDNIQQLRENELYRGAFYIREKEGAESASGQAKDDDDASLASIDADMEFHTGRAKEVPPPEEPFLSVQTSGPEVQTGNQGPV